MIITLRRSATSSGGTLIAPVAGTATASSAGALAALVTGPCSTTFAASFIAAFIGSVGRRAAITVTARATGRAFSAAPALAGMIGPAATAFKPLLDTLEMPPQSLSLACDARLMPLVQDLFEPIDRLQPLLVFLILGNFAQPRQTREMPAVLGFHLHELRRPLALFHRQRLAIARRLLTSALSRVKVACFPLACFALAPLAPFAFFRCAFAALPFQLFRFTRALLAFTRLTFTCFALTLLAFARLALTFLSFTCFPLTCFALAFLACTGLALTPLALICTRIVGRPLVAARLLHTARARDGMGRTHQDDADYAGPDERPKQ